MHDGEEHAFVLKGTVECIIGGKAFILEAGDSISFYSSVPHLIRNVGDVDVDSIWALHPPLL